MCPAFPGGMNWKDLEFIRELPAPPGRMERPDELTGWETIVFELTDDDDEE